MKRLLCLVACLSFLISSCEQKNDSPVPAEVASPVATPEAPLITANLLQEPIEAVLIEGPGQVLPVWRRCRGAEPALVLFSAAPLLQPVPEALRDEVRNMLRTADDKEILERTDIDRPDPLLLPSMALDAALDAGLFAEVVWVLPSAAPPEELRLEVFRKQLLDFGAVDKAEAASLTLTDGSFSGTVRGIPFRAVHPDALPAIERPVVLHIDQNFFPPLYMGEIKTPLYPLLYGTLAKIREANWQGCAATVARSTATGELPLDSRFIGTDLASLLSAPEQLDQPLPVFRKQRASALYLPNFFQNEKIRELYLEMETAAPEDASVKYGLYKIHRDLKKGNEALKYLEQAVSLDRAYAFEYLALAPVAEEKGLPDQALKMIRLAQTAMPGNPFISLEMAAHLIKLNHPEQALEILEELHSLSWSKVYYPDMSGHLEAMMTTAKEKHDAKTGG